MVQLRGLSFDLSKVPWNPLIQGCSSRTSFPSRTSVQASIRLRGCLFRMFVANPTAMPEPPLRRTVGMMGRKNLGSISSPSSYCGVTSSKSL
jgi:hypothetical protein